MYPALGSKFVPCIHVVPLSFIIFKLYAGFSCAVNHPFIQTPHFKVQPHPTQQRLWHCVKLNLITEEYFPPTVSCPIQACHTQLFSMSFTECGVNESPLSVSLLMSTHGESCIYFSSVHVKCKTANRPFVSVGKRKFYSTIKQNICRAFWTQYSNLEE